MESYTGRQDYIRPGYLNTVDIIGTQSRYGDQTSTKENYETLTHQGTLDKQVWCTMCSQEFTREINMPLSNE